MKHLRIAIVTLALAATTPAIADQAEYDDCMLEHLKGAKLDVATHLIKQACEENYRKPGPISKERRTYNNCLLEHLIEVESIQAAMDIRSACDSKYR